MFMGEVGIGEDSNLAELGAFTEQLIQAYAWEALQVH